MKNHILITVAILSALLGGCSQGMEQQTKVGTISLPLGREVDAIEVQVNGRDCIFIYGWGRSGLSCDWSTK